MNVNRKELMAASDVTLVTKRKLNIYAYTNLICYLIQMLSLIYLSIEGTFSAISIFYFGKPNGTDVGANPKIPIQMQDEIETLGWLLLVSL